LIAVFEIAKRRPGCSKYKHLTLQCIRQPPTHEIFEVANAHARTEGTCRATAQKAEPYSVSTGEPCSVRNRRTLQREHRRTLRREHRRTLQREHRRTLQRQRRRTLQRKTP